MNSVTRISSQSRRFMVDGINECSDVYHLSEPFWSSSGIISDAVAAEMSSSLLPQGTELAVSFALVTASDMIPFVPCQPIAIATAAKLGWIAYPILVAGQTTAGLFSFTLARKTADSGAVQNELSKLNPKAVAEFEEFRTKLGASSSSLSFGVSGGDVGTPETGRDGDVGFDADTNGNTNATTDIESERKILLALIGLRLAPFFPFSAGNYLLGGATSVGARPFVIATVFGCLLSNIINVGVGVGGETILSEIFPGFKAT